MDRTSPCLDFKAESSAVEAVAAADKRAISAAAASAASDPMLLWAVELEDAAAFSAGVHQSREGG